MNAGETQAAVRHLIERSHRLGSDPHTTSYGGSGEIYDVRCLSNVNREGPWALSVVFHDLGRNTHTLYHGIANQASGPGTENPPRENAAGGSVLAASGSFLTTGPRSAGCKLTDLATPLECRFLAGVSHTASGMQLAKVNEVAKALLPRNRDSIKEPNLGVPFRRHAAGTHSADTRAGSRVPQRQSTVHRARHPA